MSLGFGIALPFYMQFGGGTGSTGTDPSADNSILWDANEADDILWDNVAGDFLLWS